MLERSLVMALTGAAVAVRPNPHDPTGRMVAMKFADMTTIPMYADEARRLATFLLEAAAAAERPDRPEWPDWLGPI